MQINKYNYKNTTFTLDFSGLVWLIWDYIFDDFSENYKLNNLRHKGTVGSIT